MTKTSDHIVRPIRWLDTLVFPIIVGLMLGGVVYLCLPNPIGQSIGIGLGIIGLPVGILITINRIKKNKGPVIFHPQKKP